MTDVRCPMCSKLNPPDREECQFCQARLKPLVANPYDDQGSILSRSKKQDPAPFDEDAPDWLGDLRQSEPSGEETSRGEDIPDWLQELGAAEAPAEEDEAGGDPVDWLARISGSEEVEPAEEQASEPQEFDSDEPEWLRTIRMRQADAGEEQPPSEPLPDWLAASQNSTEEETGDVGQEVPDWLDSPSAAAAEEPEAEADLPDWLTQAGADREPPLDEPADQVPQEIGFAHEEAFYSSLETGEAAQGEGEPEQAGEESGELPEWLAESYAESSVSGPQEQNLGQEEEEPVPDWLAEAAADLEAQGEPSPASEETSGELPDWLSGAALESEPDARPDEQTPEWLSAPAFSGTPEEEQDQPEAEAERSLPAWLSDAGITPQESDEDDSAGLPDWLAGASLISPSELSPTPPFEDSGEEIEEEALPDWLAQAASEAEEDLHPDEDPVEGYRIEVLPGEGEAAPTPLGGLPDWIAHVEEEGQTEDLELDEAETAGTGAAPELPGWLEAMRPVETFTAPPAEAEREAPVERVGPLAGLHSVLPAEADSGEYRKPGAYSVKLKVTENQQMHAELLEKLLAAENEPKPLPARARRTSQALLRVLIAILLIGSLVLVRWLDPGSMGLFAAGYDEAVVNSIRLVDDLQPGAPVLVAFDYEPGLSGEMDAASAGLVERIARRQAVMALISTLPDGPVNAERFLLGVSHRSDVPLRYVNLGYVSGGAVGLRSFTETPRQVFPYTLDTLKVWENEAFQGIRSAADFELVVVITENPVSARSWIEQAGPVLQTQDVPLIMIVSAQAEPLVRPYYSAFPRQVAGMVSGIAGGAVFEDQTGIPAQAGSVWSAFSAGLTAAALLLIVGGVISAAASGLSRRKDIEGG
jgi:hypothetical protein